MSTRKARKRLQPEIDVEEIIDDDPSDAQFLERVKAPIIWGRLPEGFTTRDIKESEFENVIQFIKDTYLGENLLCNNVNILEDEKSVEDILFYFLNILKDRCSVCIVDNNAKRRIVGVILLRVINRDDYGKVFSRLRLTEGEAFSKIKRAYNYLNRKTDLYKILKCDSYLRVYVLSVDPEYRKKNLGLFLLRAAVEVTRSFNLLVLMGIFDKNNFQKKARKIGLETAFEIYYVDWLENGEIVFSDPGPGNYTLSLMAGRLFAHKKRSSGRSTTHSSRRSSMQKDGSKILRRISKAIERDSQSQGRSSRGSKSDQEQPQTAEEQKPEPEEEPRKSGAEPKKSTAEEE